jgi:transposase
MDHRGEAADCEETLRSGKSISMLARRHGVAPNLPYRWRRLLTEGGAVAVQADDAVTGNAELRRLQERMRELERQLGRKTLEGEILKEALARSRTKNRARPELCTKVGGCGPSL